MQRSAPARDRLHYRACGRLACDHFNIEQFTIVDLASRPRKKTGTRFLPAPLFRRTILRVLWADDRVVGEVQIVRSSAIEIDPTLDHVAVSRIETHRQRGRT